MISSDRRVAAFLPMTRNLIRTTSQRRLTCCETTEAAVPPGMAKCICTRSSASTRRPNSSTSGTPGNNSSPRGRPARSRATRPGTDTSTSRWGTSSGSSIGDLRDQPAGNPRVIRPRRCSSQRCRIELPMRPASGFPPPRTPPNPALPAKGGTQEWIGDVYTTTRERAKNPRRVPGCRVPSPLTLQG